MTQQTRPNLQSKGGRDVLDIIDSLRSQGISQYIDLPQIIVCGDQSSGKSSVLEAISGLAFPTKDALCTRFATELVLRRSSERDQTELKVSIIPGKDRSADERQRIEAFGANIQELNLDAIVDEAMDVMGLTGTDRVFCTDILRVEVASPDQPHLTLVDLPGLFVAGNKDQSLEDSKLVESLVLSYMEQPRSIILAVVSAKSEFALQQVTQRAREVDSNGDRTLGLITKPDTLDVGSESEKAYLELAQNKDVNFRLGWHVVRNRDFSMRNATNAERDVAEKAFFSQGVWASLSPKQVGVDALRTRLSRVLQDHIMSHLPRVLDDIQLGVADCDAALEKLGQARETLAEQRRYLFSLSQAFVALVKCAVDGDYSDRRFFGESNTPGGNERRLRAQIQNTLSDFSKSMRLRGHSKAIVEDEVESTKSPSPEPAALAPRKVPRFEFVNEVNTLLRTNRGRELPGTFNPLVVGEMFSAQCEPWARLARKHVERVSGYAKATLIATLQHVADSETARRLIASLLNPAFAVLEVTVENKLLELLQPHTNGHPITYNHYLTENIQKAQSERHNSKIFKVFKRYADPNSTISRDLVPAQLYSAVKKATEPNMENYAAMLAIDTMEAYYKVALKKFVDDVSVLAIEQCLVQKLPSIFSSDFICDLTDEQVGRLAGESADLSIERSRMTEKRKLLQEGLAQLGSLNNTAIAPL
ncbi:unnamed protein product [Clonostachys solani]|uniref:Interferon-induced GTP-binding protein Mx n=1 Tax=Clonostachys solani TaxID=160281 RepID=A0A9N9YZW4_9HYPO|nr:unnamed protein product [Clonostachys solani]